VLDHVERRRFLVQPAGKDTGPAPVRLLDIDLDESAGEFLQLPRRGRLAGAQAHDHVLPPHRLARVQSDVLDDAVALVEDAEGCDPLAHRGDARLIDARRRGGVHDHRLRAILLVTAGAGGERERQYCQGGAGLHAYSGFQGW
jgi:hypothetical protein